MKFHEKENKENNQSFSPHDEDSKCDNFWEKKTDHPDFNVGSDVDKENDGKKISDIKATVPTKGSLILKVGKRKFKKIVF